MEIAKRRTQDFRLLFPAGPGVEIQIFGEARVEIARKIFDLLPFDNVFCEVDPFLPDIVPYC